MNEPRFLPFVVAVKRLPQTEHKPARFKCYSVGDMACGQKPIEYTSKYEYEGLVGGPKLHVALIYALDVSSRIRKEETRITVFAVESEFNIKGITHFAFRAIHIPK